MVSSKVLDERGVLGCGMEELREPIPDPQVFTRDMDGLADRMAELMCTLQVLGDRARDSGDLDMHFVLGAASRLLFGILRDLVLIDETLRRRGAIVDAHEHGRAEREPRGRSRCPRSSNLGIVASWISAA